MKISIFTLGCKVNQSESFTIEGNLIKNGCSIVSLSDQPDYCIINTCTVTSKSDYQSRQLIRRAIKSGARLIVTGCYSQLQPDYIRGLGDSITIVDITKKLNIIRLITGNDKSITYDYCSRSRPYLKIQDGCNLTCSYCIIQKVRGRSKSLDIKEVIKQAIDLERAGFKEIVLTGIHLGSYGHDLIPGIRLSDVVKNLLLKTEIPRIRLSSLEVNEIDDELFELLQENRICNHLHIPLQSGDDNILHLMNRKYKVKSFISKVETIFYRIKNVSIGTDIIVGFPYEGDREFNNTKNIIYSLPLSYIHVFPFSPRNYTLASKMPMQVSSETKKNRVNELNDLNNKKKNDFIFSQMNKMLDIIVEDEDNNNTVAGTSSNYLKICVPSNGYIKGSLIRVKIAGIKNNRLVGYPID